MVVAMGKGTTGKAKDKKSKYEHMDNTELKIFVRLKKLGYGSSEIQSILQRSKATITRKTKELTVKGAKKTISKDGRKVGRPKIITPQVFERLMNVMNKLQKRANAKKDVTVDEVKEKAGVDASDKSVLRAFHLQGVWFKPLAEKCLLTKEDITKRLEWSKTRKRRARKQWVVKPHATIDNKSFPLFVNGKGRDYAARRSCRGAFKSRGDHPHPWLIRGKGTMKFPAKRVMVTAAVVRGKIRMWQYHTGRWNGGVAAAMYSGPLLKTLRRAFPAHAAKRNGRWTVLEDNDPSGYKSKKAVIESLS